MKQVVKSGFLGIILVMFFGCGQSIEAPLVELSTKSEFLFGLSADFIDIQSQDNETIIEDIIVNRGNCGVLKYKKDQSKITKYENKYLDRIEFSESGSEITMLKTTDNKSIELSDAPDTLYNGEKRLDFYNSLDEISKSIYTDIIYAKLAFGEKTSAILNCKLSNVIEAEIVTNGGSFTYTFNK